jgi:hypothetical protein
MLLQLSKGVINYSRRNVWTMLSTYCFKLKSKILRYGLMGNSDFGSWGILLLILNGSLILLQQLRIFRKYIYFFLILSFKNKNPFWSIGSEFLEIRFFTLKTRKTFSFIELQKW